MIGHITLKTIKALFFTAILGWLTQLAYADTSYSDLGTLSNQASKTSLNPGPRPIRIGVLAKRGRAQCLQKWGPTAEYLSSVIPERSFAILPLDFDEILAAVKRKEVEFVLANSSFYIELEVLFGAKRIATLNNLQSDGTALDIFAGTIFCRADRHDLNSIQDLKNKTFMAVDRRSLGGWHMAWRELRDNHIDPKRNFKALHFGGTHDAVVYAIQNGRVAAGCVRSDTLERMAAEGKIDLDDFKLISQHDNGNEIIHFMHSTRHYPEWPFVKAAHTDEGLSKKVALALMTMPVDSPAACAAKCAGWTIPSNYQPVRECLMELHLPPYQDYGKISLGGFIRQYYLWLIGITALMVFIVVSLNRAARLKRNLRESLLANEERKRAQRFLQTVIDGFPEAMMVINLDYTIALANRPVVEMARGQNLALDDLKCHRVNHGSDTPCDSEMHPCPLSQVLDTKETVMMEHIHHDKEGKQVVFEIVAAPIFSEKGEIVQIIESCRDVSDRKRHEEVLSAHLMLSEFSLDHSVRDLLRRCIDEAERLTGSMIGFFHFVEPDQETISLQIWSSSTLERMGKHQPQNSHYPISKAGICAECVNARQAVIHNDCPHPKVSLEEYPPVFRELAVPVFRGEKIVAILGVGNKKTDYDEEDVGIVSDIAGMTWDIVLRKWAEEALRESEAKYRSMMEAMVDAAYICSADYHIEYMNPAMIKRVGRDGTGECCYKLIHGLEQPCQDCNHEKVMQGEHVVAESQNLEEGKTYHVSSSPIFHVDGSVSKLTVFRDITEIKDMEARLLQAQKMEAIGTLASGIAHDFNNVLFPLIGYTELLKADIPGQDPKQNHIDQILKAAFRSRDLVSQILAFSRQNTQRLIPMKMQPIVKEALKLLRSSIPTTIDIKHNIDPSCGLVIADPTQIHQIIMNLCTNSLHAMEKGGGRMEVTLKQARLNGKPVASSDLMPGLYALLTVSDTGSGIDKDIVNRIFDPYFTTKETGKGTGLGLSMVQSIVKSCKGEIQVASSPGRGTTMSVYLPIVESETDKHPVVDLQDVEGGTERILLVDDEKDIVEMLKQMLERFGYRVAAFTSSIDALVAFKTNPHSFDLILTDMTMPHKTGIELAMETKRTRPEIPVLLCTGFSDQINEAKCEALGIQGLVMKPVISNVLAKTIRAVLDSKGR